MESNNCILCLEKLNNKVIFYCCKAFICIDCFSKLYSKIEKSKNKIFDCCFCKIEVKKFYILNNINQEVFLETNFVYQKYDLTLFFENQKIKNFFFDKFEIICKICSKYFSNNKEIIYHYNNKHKLLLCSLCLDNKFETINEWDLYTKEELNLHLKEGSFDKNKMRIYHPICKVN